MAEQRGAGRPTKLTPEIAAEICKNLRLGAHPQTAAEAAGVCRRTYFGWLERGENEPGSEYEDFLHSARIAMAHFKLGVVRKMRKAASQPSGRYAWQALAWLAERRFQDEFGRPRVEITGAGGGPVATETRQAEDRADKLVKAGPKAIAYFARFHRVPTTEDLDAWTDYEEAK